MSGTRATTIACFLLSALLFIGIQLSFAGTAAPVAATASCHEDPPDPAQSVPVHNGPANHDCCLLGHLHAILCPQTATIPALIICSSPRVVELLRKCDILAKPLYNEDDAAPPGAPLSLRL
jgi:hypothetical protein